jgi:hypothetical protein
MTSRAKRITSEGASLSTCEYLEMKAGWIFKKKKKWSQRNRARRQEERLSLF